MAGRSIHMGLSVRGAILNEEWREDAEGSLVGCTRNDAGRLMGEREILASLLDLLEEGVKVIPLCPRSECPDFDPVTGCPGHEQTQEEWESACAGEEG